jgi:hypothetical protein
MCVYYFTTTIGPIFFIFTAIYQKAEALYHLGDFEHSLVFYHRGLHVRPELEQFRLGVQKAREAIENAIGKFKSFRPCNIHHVCLKNDAQNVRYVNFYN